MAESIIQNIVESNFDRTPLIKWLNSATEQLDRDFKCTSSEFAACFLNYIHEEASRGGTEDGDLDESREDDESPIKTWSPSSTIGSPQVKTPDHRCSPVSPLYRNANVITPRRERPEKIPRSQTPLCIGDFVVRHSKQKKKRNGKGETPSAEKPKRINPTKLEFHSNRVVENKDNSFDFKEACGDFSRNALAEERRTILAKQSPMKIKLNGIAAKEMAIAKVKPDIEKVTKREMLDALVEVYSSILDMNNVNMGREMVFVMNLLFFTHHDGGVFENVHNIVYFATKTIEKRKHVLDHYDKPTLSLLSKNEAVINYTPQLAAEIAQMAMLKTERRLEAFRDTKMVCFDSEMDNRSNFSSVDSFNAWRKQRDLFYQILKIWTDKHHVHGFNYAQSLGGKIKALLGLHSDPSNMVRFAMMFLKQLLSCSSMENMDGLAQLPIDSEKLSLLASRLETRRTTGAAAPSGFVGREEFYRDFIVVAGNQLFTRHLFDAIVCEIADLNETKFILDDNVTDASNRNAYHACIKSLRTLAKFLGFIESLPYKNPNAAAGTVQVYPKAIMTHLLRIRQATAPSFDCHKYLRDAMLGKTLVLVVPWLTKYLTMLDQVTINLPYYEKVLRILFEIQKIFRSKAERNVSLIRSCLNTLFESPHVKDLYRAWCNSGATSSDLSDNVTDGLKCSSLDNSNIVDQNVLYLCCPYMEQVKDVLLTNSKTSFARHITPVSTSAKVVAQPNGGPQYNEESFLNSQSTSVRKTVDFITERLSSSCVKYICGCTSEYKMRFAESMGRTSPVGQRPCYRTAFADFRSGLMEDVKGDLEAKILTTVDALMSREELLDVKMAVYWIVRTRCLETVEGWMDSHITEDTFKTFYQDHYKDEANAEDVEQKLVFALPSDGIPGRPSTNECFSAENMLIKIKVLLIDIMEESREIDSSEFENLFESTYMTLSTRHDVNECIKSTIRKTLIDMLIYALYQYNSTLISEKSYKWLVDILAIPGANSHQELDSLVSARNIQLLCASPDRCSAFSAYAEFCSKMIATNQLSTDQFGRQATGIYKSEWCEDELKLISQFLRTIVDTYQRRTRNYSEFSYLLEYLSAYCVDL